MTEELLTRAEVVARVGLSQTSIYNKIRMGTFPKQIRFDPKDTRKVAWRKSEITEWIAGRKVNEPGLLCLKEVKIRVGLNRKTIYRSMMKGQFPKLVRLLNGKPRWVEKEINSFVQDTWRPDSG